MIYGIKQGDNEPSLRVRLVDARQRPIDISTASVRFFMRPKPGVAADSIQDAAVQIVDLARADVQYNWDLGDTDVVGDYEAEFKVTYLDGSVETVPNDGYIEISIIPSSR